MRAKQGNTERNCEAREPLAYSASTTGLNHAPGNSDLPRAERPAIVVHPACGNQSAADARA